MGRGSRVWRCSGPPLPAPTSHSGTLKLARHGLASVTGPWLPCQTFPVHALLPSKPLSPRPAPPRGSLDLSTLAPLTPVSWLFSRSKGCRCLVLHLECPLGQSPCLRSLSAAQCLHHSGLPGRLKAGETRKRLETLQSSQVSVGLVGGLFLLRIRSLQTVYKDPRQHLPPSVLRQRSRRCFWLHTLNRQRTAVLQTHWRPVRWTCKAVPPTCPLCYIFANMVLE